MVFASWGAGEMGNLGSNEWVEENLDKLKERAVAYVNVDGCVSGPEIDAEASFPLKDVVRTAIRDVRRLRDQSQEKPDNRNNYYDDYDSYDISMRRESKYQLMCT